MVHVKKERNLLGLKALQFRRQTLTLCMSAWPLTWACIHLISVKWWTKNQIKDHRPDRLRKARSNETKESIHKYTEKTVNRSQDALPLGGTSADRCVSHSDIDVQWISFARYYVCLINPVASSSWALFDPKRKSLETYVFLPMSLILYEIKRWGRSLPMYNLGLS